MCPYISDLWCTCMQTGNLDSSSLAKSRSSWSSAGLPLHSCIKFAYPSQWRKAWYWLSWFAQVKALAMLKSTGSWWFAAGQEHEWIGGKGTLETEETIKDIVRNLETGEFLKAILIIPSAGVHMEWEQRNIVSWTQGYSSQQFCATLSLPWSSIPSCTQIKRVN